MEAIMADSIAYNVIYIQLVFAYLTNLSGDS